MPTNHSGPDTDASFSAARNHRILTDHHADRKSGVGVKNLEDDPR